MGERKVMYANYKKTIMGKRTRRKTKTRKVANSLSADPKFDVKAISRRTLGKYFGPQFILHMIQTQKGSNERLLILTRTHNM